MFATAVILDIDLAASELVWANCGHPSPLVIAANGQVRALRPTGGLINPALPAATLARTQFTAGALLFAYSDGLSEARGAHRTPLRIDAIADALRGQHSAADACAHARTLLEQHTGTRRHRDDVTLLAARRPSAPHEGSEITSVSCTQAREMDCVP
jgi:serine phosphatase RsbU (regulator of sigma subunit)